MFDNVIKVLFKVLQITTLTELLTLETCYSGQLLT